MQDEFNLKLVFSTKDGAYISGVLLDVENDQGTSIIVTETNGPWFMADLPAGMYRVKASHLQEKRTKNVTVKPDDLKVERFTWKK